MRLIGPILVLAVVAGSSFPLTAGAQDAPKLSLELNGTGDTTDGGCRLTYVANNGLAAALDKTVFQMAVFDATGVVTRLMLLDFGALPVGKTKVMQFVIPEQSCGQISRIVVNDAATCVQGGAASTPAVCLDALATASRSTIQFGL